MSNVAWHELVNSRLLLIRHYNFYCKERFNSAFKLAGLVWLRFDCMLGVDIRDRFENDAESLRCNGNIVL